MPADGSTFQPKRLTFGPDPAKAFDAAMAKLNAEIAASGYALPKASTDPVEYEAPFFRRRLLEG